MKKVSCLLFLVSFLGFNLSSCSKDDEPNYGEQEDIYVVDELEVLQNSLAKIDENGNLVERVLGVSLDAAAPDEVSVGVDNYHEAVDIFTSLFADTTVISNNGTVATFAIKDGKAELVASSSDANGQVAYAKFDVPGLKHVSKVNFILNSAWPDNDGGKGYHKFGMIYEAKGWTGKGYLAQNDYIKPDAMFKYLCIREYNNGKPALLFAICTDKFQLHPRSLSGAGGNIPNEQKAKEIASILQKDWATYKQRMKDAYGMDVLGEGDDFTYWINKARDYGFWVNQYYIRLNDSHIDWNDTHSFGKKSRFTLFYMESGAKL